MSVSFLKQGLRGYVHLKGLNRKRINNERTVKRCNRKSIVISGISLVALELFFPTTEQMFHEAF